MTPAAIRSACVFVAACAVASVAAQEARLPAIKYTADGRVPLPDYRKWVFVGSGAFDAADTAPAPRFSNVFVDPAAYDAYLRAGEWPDRTVIVGEKRSGVTTRPITANPGWGQTGAPLGFEFAVKDSGKGGWRYYTAGASERAGTPVANQADCTTCHAQHGAVDHTFVQFYPALVEAARRHGTYRPPTQ